MTFWAVLLFILFGKIQAHELAAAENLFVSKNEDAATIWYNEDPNANRFQYEIFDDDGPVHVVKTKYSNLSFSPVSPTSIYVIAVVQKDTTKQFSPSQWRSVVHFPGTDFGANGHVYKKECLEASESVVESPKTTLKDCSIRCKESQGFKYDDNQFCDCWDPWMHIRCPDGGCHPRTTPDCLPGLAGCDHGYYYTPSIPKESYWTQGKQHLADYLYSWWPWIGEQRAECTELGNPVHGRVVVSSKPHYKGTTAEYDCEAGYKVSPVEDDKRNDVKRRKCQNVDGKGVWEGKAPVCEKDPDWCDLLEQPTSGHKSVMGRALNNTASFFCIPGLITIGASILTCTTTGWDGKEPTCEVDEKWCNATTSIPNGRVTSQSLKMNGMMDYECGAGYLNDTMETPTCLSTREWTPEPTCIRNNRYCTIPVAPANGGVIFKEDKRGLEDTFKYECNDGFEPSGEVERECGVHWDNESAKPITCGEKTEWCDPLPPIENVVPSTTSRSVFTRVEFSCKDGYSLLHDTVIVCKENQNWSDSAPSCQRIDAYCPEAPRRHNMLAFPLVRHVNVTIVFQCEDGYEIVRTDDQMRKEIRCLPNGEKGKWDYDPPVCQKKIDFCDTPQISFGSFAVTGSGTSVGSTVRYTCFDGFEPVDDMIRECLESRRWSGTQPHCKEIDPYCLEIAELADGIVETTKGRTIDSEAYIHCNPGYTPDPEEHRVMTCMAGRKWDPPRPTCKRDESHCYSPEQTGKHLFIKEHTGNHVGAKITYKCKHNLRLDGAPELTCTDNKKWSADPPQCKEEFWKSLTSPVMFLLGGLGAWMYLKAPRNRNTQVPIPANQDQDDGKRHQEVLIVYYYSKLQPQHNQSIFDYIENHNPNFTIESRELDLNRPEELQHVALDSPLVYIHDFSSGHPSEEWKDIIQARFIKQFQDYRYKVVIALTSKPKHVERNEYVTSRSISFEIDSSSFFIHNYESNKDQAREFCVLLQKKYQ